MTTQIADGLHRNAVLMPLRCIRPMSRSVDAQTLGPLLVFGAFAASDAAVRLLNAYPGSAFSWYLNFDLFYTFEVARTRESPLGFLFGPYGLLITGFLLVAGALARAANVRFMIAFMANLSFATVLALLYCRLCDPDGRVTLAWRPFVENRHAELVVGMILLGTSGAAFVASHLAFVAAVLQERGQHRIGRFRVAMHPIDPPVIAATC